MWWNSIVKYDTKTNKTIEWYKEDEYASEVHLFDLILRRFYWLFLRVHYNPNANQNNRCSMRGVPY